MSGRILFALLVSLLVLPVGALAQENPHGTGAGGPHVHENLPAPEKNFLSEASREALMPLFVQDFQGRMKPLDTLSRETVRKITKRTRFKGWEPLDLYMSWIIDAPYWFGQPLISVHFPELKNLLGVSADTEHVSLASLLDERGEFRLRDKVEEAFRAPDRERSKLQRKLLDFHDQMNLLLMSMNQATLRIYPLPHDDNNTWLAIEDLLGAVDGEHQPEFKSANEHLMAALKANDESGIVAACREHEALQARYGAQVHMSGAALSSELFLNRIDPFKQVMTPLLVACLLLVGAYIWCLAKRQGKGYSLRHPLYLGGFLIYVLSLLFYLVSFIMRWIASGRAPVSNGYESLIWIGLMVVVAGFIFEFWYRKGLVAGLAALLSVVILGVSLLSAFNPAIGPLVPVLNSYWLNIHVTIITSSYAFLSLSALVAMTLLILHLFKGPERKTVRDAVVELSGVHWWLLVTGLGLISVGTLLGGVWANESWGRYWGWDSKETWALVTVLVYAAITHFRFIPMLSRPWIMAAASFIGISAVIMTYFGVNYFLAGLHSYAAGDAAQVPRWTYLAVLLMIILLVASWWRDRTRSWPPGKNL